VVFPVNIYVYASLSAFVISFFAVPMFNRLCRGSQLVDDPGHRKIHCEPVPLSGGLALFTALIVPLCAAIALIWFQSGGHSFNEDLLQPSAPASQHVPPSLLNPGSAFLLRHGVDVRGIRLAGILLGTFGILIIGLLDDRHELKPALKFAGQFVVALLTAAAGVRITLFIHNSIFHYAITILWILAVINAFNFMDNMNGLCAGLGAIAAATFAFMAAISGQYLVATVCFLVVGGLAGFLPHNFPRARAFLGDSGSHVVGYLLAVIAVLPHFYSRSHSRPFAVLIPLLALAVPLGDMAYVVVLRTRMGKPFYVGDTNHLSHRLVRSGKSKTAAVLIIWSMAAVGAAVSFLLN
jgi:UDP-GlcNAc:undecaprenyl-phosphate GlcNAc-1-phosphate transferase